MRQSKVKCGLSIVKSDSQNLHLIAEVKKELSIDHSFACHSSLWHLKQLNLCLTFPVSEPGTLMLLLGVFSVLLGRKKVN